MNNFRLTDQHKKRISSVQSIPMKHCAEYSVEKRIEISSESQGETIPFLKKWLSAS